MVSQTIGSLAYVTAARMPTEKAHGVSIAHMCKAFVERGILTELVVPTRHNPLSQDIFSFYQVPHSFSVRSVPCPDFVGRGYTHPFFFFFQRILFIRALKRAGIGVVTIYTREPEVVFAFAKTHTVVYEAHRWPTGLKGILLGFFVRRARLIVCNSRGTEVAARTQGCVRTMVAPNGFDPELFATKTPSREELGLPEGMVAMYVGSDASWKGVGVLRAAAELVQDVQVVIVGGKGESKARCLEFGGVPPALVPGYLKNADILVLPNTAENEESQRFTSPIKLFEYLAAGKAIVASDLPSIREIISEGQVVFARPGDATDLARAITELACDPIRRRTLGHAAQTLSAKYTWQTRAEKIIEELHKQV